MNTDQEYQDYIDEAAKEMCRQLDAHILAEQYIKSGWAEVVVDPWRHSSSSTINYWCKHNIGKFIKDGNRWIIKDAKDATMFALRWL